MVMPGTGVGTDTPTRMSFTTVADNRAGSPPFVEDFYFAGDCMSFTKVVRAPGTTRMVCTIKCSDTSAA